MRPRCNFICLVLFTFCPLARVFGFPDVCCFSFSNVRIPVKQVESYYITHPVCTRTAIIFITKAQREICADPTERWVQRLKKLVDARKLFATNKLLAGIVKMTTLFYFERKTESIRTSETAPLQRPEETTLVHLTDSNDWLDFDTTQANPNTEHKMAPESAVVHLKE
ncbi:hypothetical protein PO909_010335 [Leuciscus waleckii]